MIDIADFASLFKGARRTGQGRYIAHCSAHEDRLPSLSITQMPDGNIRPHCFAGCNPHDICHAVGIKWRELFANNHVDRHMPKNAIPASDILRCLQADAMHIAIFGCDIYAFRRGEKLLPTDEEFERVKLAAGRIMAAYE